MWGIKSVSSVVLQWKRCKEEEFDPRTYGLFDLKHTKHLWCFNLSCESGLLRRCVIWHRSLYLFTVCITPDQEIHVRIILLWVEKDALSVSLVSVCWYIPVGVIRVDLQEERKCPGNISFSLWSRHGRGARLSLTGGNTETQGKPIRGPFPAFKEADNVPVFIKHPVI